MTRRCRQGRRRLTHLSDRTGVRVEVSQLLHRNPTACATTHKYPGAAADYETILSESALFRGVQRELWYRTSMHLTVRTTTMTTILRRFVVIPQNAQSQKGRCRRSISYPLKMMMMPTSLSIVPMTRRRACTRKIRNRCGHPSLPNRRRSRRSPSLASNGFSQLKGSFTLPPTWTLLGYGDTA